MAGQKHIIERCVLDLAFASEKQALEAQKEIPAILNDQLLAEIDRILSMQSDPDEVVFIDRLELDLGQIATSDLKSGLTQRMLSQLDREIKRIIERPGTTVAVDKKSENQAKSRIITNEGYYLELFFQFLDNGVFPNWAPMVSLGTLGSSILKMAAGKREEMVRRFGQLTRPSMAAKRIASQFSQTFSTGLAQILFPLYGSLDTTVNRILKDRLKEESRILSSEKSDELKILLTDILWEHFMSAPAAPPEAEKISNLVYDRIFAGQEVIGDTDSGSEPLPEAKHKEASRKEAAFKDPDAPGLPVPATAKQQIEEKGPGSADQSYYIRNAGLVLLWPWLESFFNALGLTHNGHFVDRTRQEKALLISEFLTTGDEEFPEPEMILNKVMMGWPLEETFHKNIKISAKEKTECSGLLTALVRNWTALKDTSPDGLRDGFLIRNGKLSLPGDNWLLQVERKGVDILMDQLPWPVAIIRLPWNKYLIYTEW